LAKDINGLAAPIEPTFGLDSFAAALYVFGDRRRERNELRSAPRRG
jgi:hypothetical protein